MSTNLVALLGFVSAAEKYISAHAKQEGIEELINLDINKLKKQLSDELSAFDVYDNHKLVKAGEEAFEDYINDRIKELNAKKKNVIEELGEIFNVDFDNVGIEDEDVAKETLDNIFDEYKEETKEAEEAEEEINYFGLDEDDETLKAISNAASGNLEIKDEPAYIPASDEIDDIYNEVIEHENSNLEETIEEEAEDEEEVLDLVETSGVVEPVELEETLEIEPTEEVKTEEESLGGFIPLSQVLREFSKYETPTPTNYYSFTLQDALDDENPSKTEVLEEIEMVDETEKVEDFETVEETVESEELEVIETIDEPEEIEETIEPVETEPVEETEMTEEASNEELIEEVKTELEEALLEYPEVEEESEEISEEEKMDLIPDFDYHYYDPSEDTSQRILVNPCYSDDLIEEETLEELEEVPEVEESEAEEETSIDEEVVEEENVQEELSLTEEIVQEVNELNQAVLEESEYDWDFLNPSIFHYIENPGLDVVFNGDEIFEVNNDIYDEEIVNKDVQEDETPTYSEVIQNPGVDSEIEYADEQDKTIDELSQYMPIDFSNIVQNPGVDSEVIVEEENDEPVVEVNNSFITNPGLDGDIEESEPQEEIEESEDDYLDSLMSDISLDKEEKIVIEDEKVEIYKEISKMFPYLSYAFVKSAFDLKETISNSYEEGEEVIVLHRSNFKDVDDLRKFVEIAMMHGYDINADELKMIVDAFKKHVNTDGLILNNIFEIANQVRLLNGQYEGYRVLTKDDE